MTPEAVERGVQHALREIRTTITQVDGGQYPEYNANCRKSIGAWLDGIAASRARQVEFGGGPYAPVAVPGLTMAHLPGDATLAQLRAWERWIVIAGTIRLDAPTRRALGEGVARLQDGDLTDGAAADAVIATMVRQGYVHSGYDFFERALGAP